MESYIDPQLLDPQLLDSVSSTDSEAEVQSAIVDAGTEDQECFLGYPPQNDGYVFQSHVPSYYPPLSTDFMSLSPPTYPEAPLMEPGFDYNFFNPHTSMVGPAAPDFMLPMYPYASEPLPLAYSNFPPPPFPASYHSGPGSVQPSPLRPVPTTQGINRLRARKAVYPNNASQPKNKGKKVQPIRQPKQKKAIKPLPPTEALKLNKPLSQLALELPHICIYDIDTYILRGADNRYSRKGDRSKVCRPSNAFVLYRKAYTDHIKAVVGTNQNHVVSRLAGASWRMETKEIKHKFSEYAREEKRQHVACFPDNKFAPIIRKQKGNNPEAEVESDNELVLDEVLDDVWDGMQYF